MGVLEIGGDFDFLQESFGTEDGGELRMENLERDLTVIALVVRKVDGGHATAADLAFNHVSIGQRGLETVQQLCHLPNFGGGTATTIRPPRRFGQRMLPLDRR